METPLSTTRCDPLFNVGKTAMGQWGIWGENL